MKNSFLLVIVILSFSFFNIQESHGSNFTYKVSNQTYEGYLLKGSSDEFPLILLVHDWDGLTSYEVKRAQMLNHLGYSVFAVDLFGKGIRPIEDKDKRQHTGELYKDRKKMRDHLQSALIEAQHQGIRTEKIVAVGYCFGGSVVLEWARSGVPLKAFISFHGGLSTPEGQDYKSTKGPIYIFHGSSDTSITMDQFALLAKELNKAKIPHEMTTYGGAQHAFTVFGEKRYDSKSDQASWDRLLKILTEIKKIK